MTDHQAALVLGAALDYDAHEVTEAARTLGRRGGRVSTPAKREANRARAQRRWLNGPLGSLLLNTDPPRRGPIELRDGRIVVDGQLDEQAPVCTSRAEAHAYLVRAWGERGSVIQVWDLRLESRQAERYWRVGEFSPRARP